MKVAIIYYSGTGNTEAMANAVLEGCPEATLMNVSEVSADEALGYDVLLLGCPAMGAEELDPSEMEPFFSELEGNGLSGKKVGLFGSYGWGDGEWMRIWQDRVEAAGGELLGEGVTANEYPDEQALEACRELGRSAK